MANSWWFLALEEGSWKHINERTSGASMELLRKKGMEIESASGRLEESVGISSELRIRE